MRRRMAFRLVKQRRERRIVKKLNEIFQVYSLTKVGLISFTAQDRDKAATGRISYEQLEDVFRIYQVRGGTPPQSGNDTTKLRFDVIDYRNTCESYEIVDD